jgi:hypothetical protein
MTRPGSHGFGALSDCPTIRRREGAKRLTDTIVTQKIARQRCTENKVLNLLRFLEPPVGFEPTTCRLRLTRKAARRTADALRLFSQHDRTSPGELCFESPSRGR